MFDQYGYLQLCHLLSSSVRLQQKIAITRSGNAGRIVSVGWMLRTSIAANLGWSNGCRSNGPEGEEEPTKYWRSTLPRNTSFARLVDLAKMRSRIKRDYQELKQEVGLEHSERRGWRGFHHHATLWVVALWIPHL